MMKKIIPRLTHDLSNLKNDLAVYFLQACGVFKVLFMNREDLPLKMNVLNFKTLRFSLSPLKQKIIGFGTLFVIFLIVGISANNMIGSLLKTPTTKKAIAQVDKNDSKPLLENTPTKKMAYPDTQAAQFKILNDKVTLRADSHSPYPAMIKEAKIEITDQKEFRIKIKLGNNSSEKLTGGISGYLSYVDHENTWNLKYSHDNTTKQANYLIGESTKYSYKNESTKYLTFNFNADNIKAVNTLHIYLKDQACFASDDKLKPCYFETAKKKFSAYIEPNIELNIQKPNYATYKP